MAGEPKSFLGLEGLHVFLTGAAGGIGSAAVKEFLDLGCRVTTFDRRPLDASKICSTPEQSSRLFSTQGDLTIESSISEAFDAATKKFGPANILIANAGITDESAHPPIWEIETSLWDKVNGNNVRGTFLTVKHFLLSVKKAQEAQGAELDNVALVITGSETGKFGQEGHAEYASGKAGLQYGLVRTVKNEIVRLNSKARINAVAPGWVNTALIGDRLDDPKEMWAECQATVALKKIAQPEDVARAMAFLASHRAAGHISGECISVDGGMEGRIIWREDQILGTASKPSTTEGVSRSTVIPASLSPPRRKRRLRICLSVDFDAISGYLGTGHDPANTLSDYSAGIFSANVGVGRLLRLFKKHGIADKLTWFIPGHSLETFPAQARDVVDSGAEIGLHGYSHEGAYAMTVQQEKDVLEKCIDLVTKLKGGKTPTGYRAPLYQIRETTVQLLQDHGFLYDSSMNAHDSLPYFLPNPFPGQPPHVPDYSKDAGSWMIPTPIPEQPALGTAEAEKALVEIPGSWYTEDMTPLGFYPYSANTQGYVGVDLVEKMWMDRFEWLWENESWLDEEPGKGYGSVYPMIWHPESSGRAHIVGMIDRFIARLVARRDAAEEGEITFETMDSVARSWKDHR
ncbi:glucose 1-dehydrogenase [Capronia coronata CBS 617.96]|uniref:Glucose 1-dehydrogenase n=1 Tax=Capronia coronata CBS 617.96 TaxID=1182541 RepID=W9YME6_9EURO|nr:glucose 1-dehydrogenase [Capronia coronata CBS 617.96]EXJ90386.1 glucose 1-dehydrogenase [Capronia coronata CBS 617.96]